MEAMMSEHDKLARQRSNLSADQRALLNKWMRGTVSEAHRTQNIPRRSLTGPVALSFAQQRLWFLAQLEPVASIYILPVSFALKGPLDLLALQQSLSEIMSRHEILRTRFVLLQESPVQVIDPPAPLDLPLLDLAALPEEARESQARQLATEETRRRFDLAGGPLWRTRLLRLGAREHILLLSMHHLLCDGWSMSVLFRELSVLYAAFSAGRTSALPDLPLQYADYVLWQREWLVGELFQEQLVFWKKQLTDLPQLSLPTDHQRPALQRFQGRSLTFSFPQDLLAALRDLSHQEGVTLFMTLLAGFQVLLARCSGQEDLAVGTPVANRTRSELEGLIGLFVNTLVLRCDLSGDPSVHELLGRVRRIALSAYAHQDLPFEKLVEELNPQRNLSINPLFQVMFSLQPAPADALNLAGLVGHPLALKHSTSLFDLSMNLYEMQDGILGGVEYDCDLFENETIERIIGHYQQILAGMVARPEQRLSHLPLLTEVEREQQRTWNATETGDHCEFCLHELFEAQVERTPDAVSAVFEDQHLTYSELDRRANQLAHYLQNLGVKLETRVGISLERELLLIVALLGILKAGGAYVPLDPDYPPERLSFMLADSEVAVLLLQRRLLARLSPQNLPVVFLDDARDQIWSKALTRPVSGIKPDNLVYIIYTSGSTGRPKGAMLTHRGICNRLQWMQDAYLLTRTDRVVQKTPMSFDVSVWEFFWPLCFGACLVVAPPGAHQDPHALLQLLLQHDITVLHFVPSMLRAFLDTPGGEVCGSLRHVICSGEALPLSLQERFFALRETPLHNLYGPTETSIDVTAWTCVPGWEKSSVPIGRPLANTRIYLLNAAFQAVPVGVVGEISIGGIGVARGYWQRPDLTAERFLPDPFSGRAGARLYRTGDLARYLADGTLEFLGRLDQQVKLRGFRIELGEIEATLLAHPSVQDAAALLREDTPGEKRLIAYLIQREQSALREQEVRTYLQQRLPEYMVPAAFIFLQTFPLTANGKLDRRQFPAPEWKAVATQGYVGPATLSEDILARIWAEVLGIEQVSTHANFFEIGGDSILSLLVVARASRAGLIITPRQMFQYQTIAELAAVAGRGVVEQREEEKLEGTFPLSPIQARFFEQGFPAPYHWNQAVLLEAPYQSISPAALHKAIGHLLEQHAALRLRFTCQRHGWEQHLATATTPAHLPVCSLDLSNLAIPEQTPAIQEVIAETQASLNLETGPLLRVLHIIRRSSSKQILAAGRGSEREVEEPDLLLMTLHHLIVDGVSWRILLEDLSSTYTRLLDGQQVPEPPKTTSFKRWSEHLQVYASSPVLSQEAAHWLAETRKDVPLLPLDFVAEPATNTEVSKSTVRLLLDVEETRELLQVVPHIHHTRVDEVLLTALLLTCAPWLGRLRLLVDVEGHGRETLGESLDLSHTVGWFTSIFPVVLTLEDVFPPSSIPRDLGLALRAVKEQLRGIPQHGIGYGLLRYLSPDHTLRERLAALPQAQIVFNYLGQFEDMHSEADRGPFRPVPLAGDSLRAPQNRRNHALEINAQVRSRQLHMDWQFSTRLHRRTTIETLVQRYQEVLSALIAHCRVLETGGYTLSDFPGLGLSQTRLNKIMQKLRSANP
jgi:amino acid adenylation domain-containing protein/non-ribosomal peptide synthase protein (TIGR01720 family)